MNDSQFRQALLNLLAGEKAATGTMGYGPSGVFNAYGVNPAVANAMTLPMQGLAKRIQWRGSRYGTEKYALLTGVSAVTGVQSSDECGDAPVAGTVSIGKFSTPFGRFKLQTPVFDISRFAELKDRSAFNDYNLTGDPFAETPVQIDVPASPAEVMRTEMGKLMFEFKVGWLRTFNKILHYSGNPTNNIGNGYLEPRGLEILVNTGYTDVDTAVALPEADSLVRSFGNIDVGATGSSVVNGVTYANGNAAIVAELVAMYRKLRLTAEKTGLAPAKLVMVMSRGLFYEITAAWACNYLTARCIVSNGALSLDAGDQIALRDGMRNGSYLMIDGEQVEVLVDNDIPETLAGSTYTTSVYILPLSTVGGSPALFGEFFDFAQPGGAMEAANLIGNVGDITTTGNGRFLWTRQRTGTCLYWQALSRERLVLTTPHLAGRLTNVKYTPLIAE